MLLRCIRSLLGCRDNYLLVFAFLYSVSFGLVFHHFSSSVCRLVAQISASFDKKSLFLFVDAVSHSAEDVLELEKRESFKFFQVYLSFGLGSLLGESAGVILNFDDTLVANHLCASEFLLKLGFRELFLLC